LPLTGFSASDLCPLSAPAGFDRGLAIFANRGRQRLLRGLGSFFCGLGGVFRLPIGFLCCLPLQFGCTRCALYLGGGRCAWRAGLRNARPDVDFPGVGTAFFGFVMMEMSKCAKDREFN
jgi:hypothetical protein